MEGASGIFDRNKDWCLNGSDNWLNFGRACITSDVKAVCDAALECGIDDILLYNGHFAGNPEFNIMLENLPPEVRVYDLENRCFYWDIIRRQSADEPFGLITVGQHARFGEPDAYMAHTIQSPPIRKLWLNGASVAEIGVAAYAFSGVKYIANIGCAASHREAREICSAVSCISLKDKSIGWEPSHEKNYSRIQSGVKTAINGIGAKLKIPKFAKFDFQLDLCAGYVFADAGAHFEISADASSAKWNAADYFEAFDGFNAVRSFIRKI